MNQEPLGKIKADDCLINCPNRQKKSSLVDKGYSVLSAIAITAFLGFVSLIYERQEEKTPPFVVVPCIGLVAIALFVPTEKSAEMVGKLLSIKITTNNKDE